MRPALTIAIILFSAIFNGFSAGASDWVEDGQGQTSTMPPAAPQFNRPDETSPYNRNAPLEAPGRTAFFVTPKRDGQAPADKSGAPLEATVSKWGANGDLNGTGLNGFAQSAPPPATGGFFFQLAAQRAVPPSVFRGWLEKTHSQFALSTSTANPLNVLEVKGQWDDADHTLRSFGIRHTTIKRGKLTDIPLDDVRVIVVNCAGNIPAESFQRIRDFVARGGFLISTDWSVHNMVEKAFPGFIAWNGGKTENKVVDATVVDADPLLFAGAVRTAGWKLDDGSQTIRVLRPGVRVLARSQMLTKDDPDHTGILAVVFPFGRGQVLHLVGHFDNNATLAFGNMLPDPAPQIGISLRQALAANFLIEGLQQDGNEGQPRRLR